MWEKKKAAQVATVKRKVPVRIWAGPTFFVSPPLDPRSRHALCCRTLAPTPAMSHYKRCCPWPAGIIGIACASLGHKTNRFTDSSTLSEGTWGTWRPSGGKETVLGDLTERGSQRNGMSTIRRTKRKVPVQIWVGPIFFCSFSSFPQVRHRY